MSHNHLKNGLHMSVHTKCLKSKIMVCYNMCLGIVVYALEALRGFEFFVILICGLQDGVKGCNVYFVSVFPYIDLWLLNFALHCDKSLLNNL